MSLDKAGWWFEWGYWWWRQTEGDRFQSLLGDNISYGLNVCVPPKFIYKKALTPIVIIFGSETFGR